MNNPQSIDKALQRSQNSNRGEEYTYEVRVNNRF